MVLSNWTINDDNVWLGRWMHVGVFIDHKSSNRIEFLQLPRVTLRQLRASHTAPLCIGATIQSVHHDLMHTSPHSYNQSHISVAYGYI